MLLLKFTLFSLVLGALLLGGCTSPRPSVSTVSESSGLALIPWPESLVQGSGAFRLDAGTQIVVAGEDEIEAIGSHLAGYVREATGLTVRVVPEGAAPSRRNVVRLALREDEAAEPERYRLSVTPSSVELTAGTPAGLFYAVQTLRQLLPVPSEATGGSVEIPVVVIEDGPRFPYRGMHLDVVRHLFPVSFIKQYIDLLASYKINTFHWHLTDDQGWRIEIEQYPRLTEVGAWRRETLIGHASERPERFDGVRYGGFYTQEEVREVVAYAQERYVTIIPEIEMPGHATAALAAYPELACTDGPFDVVTKWGVFEDIFCPKEETFTFLENVLTEVMALFPGAYIHVGGDEAPKKRWEESAVAQAVMAREGLADEHQLQSYFIRRIETFLHAHGRKLIGWDEILEGGIPPRATVMSWRGTEGGSLRRGRGTT